ncbi:hypothetical protein AKJ61_01685 [candidate division MSBL1 archaeon SCGC-AAA259B11]|uniref:Uncharacterized protein n=1 Tax=candidate division MSBL1 archaeon SCGC-AAA259B11 TaxID=1698260 RepID=A0A133U702_9EURY|nr:hypothetical protein AKJ61_01685 [candidate division MSBL1 archaeon SCGC-AAA259B11]
MGRRGGGPVPVSHSQSLPTTAKGAFFQAQLEKPSALFRPPVYDVRRLSRAPCFSFFTTARQGTEKIGK